MAVVDKSESFSNGHLPFLISHFENEKRETRNEKREMENGKWKMENEQSA